MNKNSLAIHTYTLTQKFLFLMILATSFGELVNIGGINLSWFFAFLTIISYCYERLKQNNIIIPNNIHIKALLLFFLFWITYAFFQLLFIDDYQTGFWAIKTLVINAFIIIMLVLNTKRIDDIVFFNNAIIIGLAISLFIGLWEIQTGNHLVPVIDRYRIIPRAAFGNENDFATFIAFGMIALVLNYFLTHKKRVITIALLALSIYELLVINSRAIILGLMVLVICWPIFSLLNRLRKKQTYLYIILLYGLTGFIMATLLYFIAIWGGHFEELIVVLSRPGNVTSDLLRLELALGGLEGLIDSFLLGVGPGQTLNILPMNIHNFFLEILCEYGLLVFLGLLYILLYILLSDKTHLTNTMAGFIEAFIPALIFLGIASSGTNRIRATWAIITLLFLTIDITRRNYLVYQRKS